jgi:hypothetical protein
MSARDICGRCEHFTLEGGKPAEGIGRCLGYGPDHVEQFVRWDRKATILFGRARDMQKRDSWIAMQKRREVEGGDASPACESPPQRRETVE